MSGHIHLCAQMLVCFSLLFSPLSLCPRILYWINKLSTSATSTSIIILIKFVQPSGIERYTKDCKQTSRNLSKHIQPRQISEKRMYEDLEIQYTGACLCFLEWWSSSRGEIQTDKEREAGKRTKRERYRDGEIEAETSRNKEKKRGGPTDRRVVCWMMRLTWSVACSSITRYVKCTSSNL